MKGRTAASFKFAVTCWRNSSRCSVFRTSDRDNEICRGSGAERSLRRRLCTPELAPRAPALAMREFKMLVSEGVGCPSKDRHVSRGSTHAWRWISEILLGLLGDQMGKLTFEIDMGRPIALDVRDLTLASTMQGWIIGRTRSGVR